VRSEVPQAVVDVIGEGAQQSVELLVGDSTNTPVLVRAGEGETELETPKHFTNPAGMKLKLLPAGSFKMGSSEREDERQHEVRITRSFYVGVHPVTVGQFRKFVKDARYQSGAEHDRKG